MESVGIHPPQRVAPPTGRRWALSLQTLPWPALAFLGCLAGLGLRLLRLEAQSLWLDEGATYTFALLPARELIRETFTREPNPPLYYLLVHGWIGLAGSSELSLRFLSTLAGIAGLALIFRLGRDLMSPPAALAAVVLAGTSPYLVWYAQEARMYALLASLATATLLVLWHACRRPAWPAWLGFGALLLATLYTHFFGALVLLVSGIVLLASLLRSEVRRAWRQWCTAFGGAAILYLPWLAASLRAGADQSSWRVVFSLPAIAERTAAVFVHGGFINGASTGSAGPAEAVGPWLVGGEIVLAAIGLVAVALRGRGGVQAAGLLLAALVLPTLAIFAISLRQPIFGDRYVIAQAPVFYLAVAAGLAAVWRRLPLLALAGLAALAGFALLVVWTSWNAPGLRKEDFRSAAAYLDRHAGADDAILLVAEYIRMPFGYYARGPAAVIPFVGEVDRLDQSLPPVLAGRQTVWLLLSHAEQVDPAGRIRRWLAERYPTVTEQYPQGINLAGYRIAYRQADLPRDAQPLRLRFGDAVELVGYTAESGIPPTDSRLHPPSNWLHVTLYWRTIAPAPSGLRSAVRLVDGRGVWGQMLERPSSALAFFPPARWTVGEIVVEDVDVNLNPATPAGTFQLEVRLLGPDGQPLPVVGGSPAVGVVQISEP